MDKRTRDIVESIALQARYWAEAHADSQGGNGDTLSGWCAIASAKLHDLLTEQGIDATISVWNSSWGSHVFLIVDDHVVDITATQFSEFVTQPVVIMHQKQAETFEFYQSDIELATPNDLRRYQKKNRWPNAQTAYA